MQKLKRTKVSLKGKREPHIFLCHKMQNKFEKIYGFKYKKMIVSNAQYVEPINKLPKAPKAPAFSTLRRPRGRLYPALHCPTLLFSRFFISVTFPC